MENNQTLEQNINLENKETERLKIADSLGLQNQRVIIKEKNEAEIKTEAGWIRFDSRMALAKYLRKEHKYLGRRKWLPCGDGSWQDSKFNQTIFPVNEYPARLPLGALLKLQEVKDLTGLHVSGYTPVYILDEEYQRRLSDPFIVVADSVNFQYSYLGEVAGCWLVYGWKDKNKD